MIKELRSYSIQLCAGYFFRIFLLYFDIYGRNIYTLPNSGDDSENYYNAACCVAEGLKTSYGGVFSKIMGYLSRLIGSSRIYLQFIVVLFSMAAIIYVVKTLEYINVKKQIKKAGVTILCLLPNFAILSSVFIRESAITLCIAVSLYYFVRWFEKGGITDILLAFGFSLFASAFHSGSIGIAIGYAVVIILYDRKIKKFRMSAKSIILAVLCFTVFAYIYINYSDVLLTKMSGIESVEDIASGNVRGGSSYAQYVGNSSSLLNMVIYTIPRMVFFMFSPLPIQWRGLSDILAFCFSAMFYAWVWFDVIVYLKRKNAENRNIVISLIVIALCTAFIFAWGVSNAGTALRHRDKVVALYILMWCITQKKHFKIKL